MAAAIVALRTERAKNPSAVDLMTGWTPPLTASTRGSGATAGFLIYAALMTVARRPGTTWSWTENWPYEPEVGNTPTTDTFIWTWASFCFTVLAFDIVLFTYQRHLNDPDVGLTDRQRLQSSLRSPRHQDPWPVVWLLAHVAPAGTTLGAIVRRMLSRL